MTNITILPPLDTEKAAKIEKEIKELLSQINLHETRLSRSYARLGSALKEVKVEQYWMAYGFQKFSEYLEPVWTTIGKKRSQVYAILSVSETLLPHLTESQLEEIGITKAYELQRLVKQGGSLDAIAGKRGLVAEGWFSTAEGLELSILDVALESKVTAAQLRVQVNQLLNCHEAPKGLWYEFDPPGFYADEDERKEINLFWDLGRKVLEITSENEARKEIFLASVRESISTWQGVG